MLNTLPKPKTSDHLASGIAVKSDSNSTGSKNRVLNLDVLRGLAILLVLASHQVYTPVQGNWKSLNSHLITVGQTGVDLFFVLSGFLIGGLLLEEISQTAHLDVKRFLIRRAFKIWPPYFALLIVASIQLIRHDGYTIHSVLEKMWPFVLSFQNYIGPWDVITQTWSLAVEEHFYLLLPLLLYSLNLWNTKEKGSLRPLPLVIFGVLIVCNLYRIVGCGFGAYDVSGYNTHVRVDALFFGVFLSYVHSRCSGIKSQLQNRSVLLFTAGCFLVTLRFCLPEYPLIVAIQYTLLYVGYGLCLLAVTNLQSGTVIDQVMKSRISKLIAFVGVYSYSIYLWHFEFAGPFVMAKVVPHLPEALKWPLGMTLYFILSILSGIILAHLIDSPMLKLRNRLFPSRLAAIESTKLAPR